MHDKFHVVKLLLTSFLVVSSLSGCGQAVSINNKAGSLETKSNCIVPDETFAYAADPQRDPKITSPTHALALLSAPWEKESSLPVLPRTSDVVATRSVHDGTEIWILTDYSEFNVYQVETKTWRNVPAQVEESNIFIDKLLITQDGSLWGYLSRNRHNDTKPSFVLSKYNEQKARFEYVEGTQGIPAIFVDSNGSTWWPMIILDHQQNVFWFVVPENGIYSYDPTTQKSQYHADLPDMDVFDLVNDPVFSPDGNIYYLAIKPITVTNRDIRLYKFSPTTSKIEYSFLGLQPSPVVSDLYADRSGRLWFGGIGWRETNDVWYHMFPSPIFLTNIVWSGMEYRWKSPEILTESSDSRLWFRSENGLAWLDKQKETWCWFTTVQSNIVEDQKHTLWMIADGSLYKNLLNP